MNLSDTNPLALWLMPDSATSELLEALMRPLSQKTGSPLFPPHITMASGFRHQWTGDFVLPDAFGPRSVRLFATGLGCEPHFFRALYLQLQPTADLEACHHQALLRLSSTAVWCPHISLVYSDAPMREKLSWAKDVAVPQCPLIFNEWSLWGPEPGHSWRNTNAWRRWL